MELDYNFLEQVERASYFKLTEDEKIKIKKELENMLLKFEVLKNFDTENIEPMVFNLDFINNFREDEVEQFYDKDMINKSTFLDNQEYFKVPKTLS